MCMLLCGLLKRSWHVSTRTGAKGKFTHTKKKKTQVNPLKKEKTKNHKFHEEAEETAKRVSKTDLEFREGSPDLVPLWGVHVQRGKATSSTNTY